MCTSEWMSLNEKENSTLSRTRTQEKQQRKIKTMQCNWKERECDQPTAAAALVRVKDSQNIGKSLVRSGR